MSTSVESRPSGKRPFVEYDEFIEFQIRKTGEGIRTADLLTAMLGVVFGLASYLLIFTLLDQWVIEGGFGYLARLGMLVVLLSGIGAWVVWRVILPARRRVNALFVAKQFETVDGGFQNNLLTFVDLKRTGRRVAPDILNAMGKHAARKLSHIDRDAAVDRRPMLKLSYALLAIVVLIALYVVFSPKKMSASIWRALLPMSEVNVATRTMIDRVEPGHAEVLARSQVEVIADLSGEIPEKVWLHYTTDDRRFIDEPLLMRPVENGINRFHCLLAGERGQGLLQGLRYHIVAGDAKSSEYNVRVIHPPSALVKEVDYDYPAYMELEPRTDIGGAIDAWEGTKVTIRAQANMPVKQAWILYSDTEDTAQRAEEFPMTIQQGTKLTGTIQLQFRSDGTVPHFYRIQVENERGDTDPQPVLYPLHIHRDLVPIVTLHHPQGDLELPVNGILSLGYRSRDPDFLLASVTMLYQRNDENVTHRFPLFQAPPYRQVVEGVEQLRLRSLTGGLSFKPGDRITYWLEARDNLTPFGKRGPNIARTNPQVIHIVDPAQPEEVQQAAEEGARQSRERLEETRSEEVGSDSVPAEENQPMPEEQNQTPNQEETDSTQPAETNEDHPADDKPDRSQGSTGSPQSSDQAGQQGDRSPQKTDSSQGESPMDPGEDSSTEAGSGKRDDVSAQGAEGADKGTKKNDQPTRTGSDDKQHAQQTPAAGENQPPGNDQQGGTENPAARPSRQPRDKPTDDQILRELLREQAEKDANSGDQSQTEGAASQQNQDSSSKISHPDEHKPGDAAGSKPESSETTPGTSLDQPQATQAAQKTKDSSKTPSPAQQSQGMKTAEDQPRDKNGSPESGPMSSQGAEGSPKDPDGAGDPNSAAGSEGSSAHPREADASSKTADSPKNPGAKPSPSTDSGSPMNSNRTSKRSDQPTGARDEPPAAGRRDGQNSQNAQTGEQGNSTQTSDGRTGGSDAGPGDTGKAPGNSTPSPNKTGSSKSSNNSGPGSSSRPGGSQKGGSDSSSPGSKGSNQPSSSSGKGDATQSSKGLNKEGTSSESMSEKPESTKPGINAEQTTQGSSLKNGGDSPAPEQSEKPSPNQSPRKQDGQPPSDQNTKSSDASGAQKSAQSAGGENSQQGSKGAKNGSSQGEGQGQGQGQEAGGGQGGSQGSQGKGGPASGMGNRSDGSSGAPAGSVESGGSGGGEASASRGGEGTQGTIDSKDEADLADQHRAASLALKQLEDQLERGEVDEHLKQRLNITDEELQKFAQRLRARLSAMEDDSSLESRDRRREFYEMLRSIRYSSTGAQRSADDASGRSASGSGGVRRPTPAYYRDLERAYRQKLMKRSSKSSSKP